MLVSTKGRYALRVMLELAQADSAADTGQHHAEVGAEFRAFDFFFFHFLLISSSI